MLIQSSEPSPVKDLLVRFIQQAHDNNLQTALYGKLSSDWLAKNYLGIQMKVSFGQGSPARVPWIAFLSSEMSVSNGYYPVYLYYKKQGLLILAYGVSETNCFEESWPPEIQKQHQKIKDGLGGSAPRYGDSFIFKQYRVDPTSQPELNATNQELTQDLKQILKEYIQAVQVTLKDPKSSITKGVFYLEKQLEDFLVNNWENTALANNLELITENGEMKSQQYETGVGYIDILARKKNESSYVVIELKKGQTSDETVGQVSRYMGWVKDNLSDPNVGGLIIAKSIDHKLEHSIHGLNVSRNVKLFTYSLDFHLDNFQMSLGKSY